MTKRRYSPAAYAQAVETLGDVAAHRQIVKRAELELLLERAGDLVAMLRDPAGSLELIKLLSEHPGRPAA